MKLFLKDFSSLRHDQIEALGYHIIFKILRVRRTSSSPYGAVDKSLLTVVEMFEGLSPSDQVVLLGLFASKSQGLWASIARIRGRDDDFDAMIRAARTRLIGYDESPMLAMMLSSQKEAAKAHLL